MKTQSLICYLLAIVVLLSASVGSGSADSNPPGDSQPPDTSSHFRAAIPDDVVVGNFRPRVVPSGGPNFNLVTMVDVNSTDFNDGSEPSIALNPENPNIIVVHGGFSDWGSMGQDDASAFVSTDGGSTWKKVDSIDPPPGISLSFAPNDTTLFYAADSLLAGSFLGAGDIFTGNTSDPSTTGSFQWKTVMGVTQPTEQIGTTHNDQPWLVVYSHIPNVRQAGPDKQSKSSIIPLPIVMENDMFVAYGDFSADSNGKFPVPVRVAVSPVGIRRISRSTNRPECAGMAASIPAIGWPSPLKQSSPMARSGAASFTACIRAAMTAAPIPRRSTT